MLVTRRLHLLPIVLLAAAVGLGAGCTLFDDYMPGTPFSLDQPVKELSVEGEINIDSAGGSGSCPAGRAVFWGTVRNTGDVEVEGVSIVIDAYNSAGALLGSFSGSVYNGTIETNDDESITAETSLEVDQAGVFEVCSSLAFGSVARAEGRADGFVIEDTGSQ